MDTKRKQRIMNCEFYDLCCQNSICSCEPNWNWLSWLKENQEPLTREFEVSEDELWELYESSNK